MKCFFCDKELNTVAVLKKLAKFGIDSWMWQEYYKAKSEGRTTLPPDAMKVSRAVKEMEKNRYKVSEDKCWFCDQKKGNSFW